MYTCMYAYTYTYTYIYIYIHVIYICVCVYRVRKQGNGLTHEAGSQAPDPGMEHFSTDLGLA